MEEAEILCQRIGIMAKGTLRCIGTLHHLKQKYANALRLQVSFNPEDHDKVMRYLEEILPEHTSTDSFAGMKTMEFAAASDGPSLLATLFKEMEERSKEHGVRDWGISQTTLEDVFLGIVGEAEADSG